MQVLRDNKESLMAVLEAFVYDPLINWRLMQTEVEVRRPEGGVKALPYSMTYVPLDEL
jgi:FKBP12-rapamycin complex-associated protein